jgi:5'-nucleotidase
VKVIYVDMDDVLCDFIGEFTALRSSRPEIEFPQSLPGFFEGLKPIDGAIEAFEWLAKQPCLDTYILSAPSVLNPYSYTEKRLWIEKHLGLDAAHKLILSPNKALNIGEYLIDDYAYGKGQENFTGQLLHFGSEQFPDWLAIIRFLNDQIN